ncbi:UNC-50 protein [Basidiobolus meristosporus CBS 931.73]|uniref:UNC-50 protein n=1 Tax=Basidiobolus meristosporus CBS 931.73 TaxID=1314790 RepID=A0A1Y1YC80_9FUNG|nr:UNC-50 protein [Basidiobolus meristosporus CBS 931.73]|eukprot:ORX95326.1 UNC-50 protein [Basidiobolus meristosporus CBS 931.73]
MLPTYRASTSLNGKHRKQIPVQTFSPRRQPGQMLGKVFSFKDMDFPTALRQMIYLCITPQRVYRSIYQHKQTTNRWARKDPAFIILLAIFLSISGIAYGISYGRGFTAIARLILRIVCIDFIAVGIVISVLCRLFANRFLKHQSIYAVDQSIEWSYAFDIHCNSFLPIYLILYVLQFFFLPILNTDSWISLFIGNLMYLVAFSYYNYLTFLGYKALPFLAHTEIFLYPLPILAILFVLSLFGFNLSRHVITWYFHS